MILSKVRRPGGRSARMTKYHYSTSDIYCQFVLYLEHCRSVARIFADDRKVELLLEYRILERIMT